MTPDKSRTHEERFRCPQCGRMVTVTAGFRAGGKGAESLVRFECTMEGMCGSPIWDPCPMYVAYMEHAPESSAGRKTRPRSAQAKKWARKSLKEGW